MATLLERVQKGVRNLSSRAHQLEPTAWANSSGLALCFSKGQDDSAGRTASGAADSRDLLAFSRTKSMEVQSAHQGNGVATFKHHGLRGSGLIQRHLCSDPRPGYRNRAAVVPLDQTRIDEQHHVSMDATIVPTESLREGTDR